MFCCIPMKGKHKLRRRGESEGEEGTCCRVKVVVVGDGECGKTSLIQRYSSGTMPDTYTPTLFDTSTVNSMVDEKKVQMVIQDTAGQEDLDHIRPPFYINTDVVVVCFALDNPDSLDNVQSVWVPEARRYCGKKIPIVLVATKADLFLNAASTDRREASQDHGSADAAMKDTATLLENEKDSTPQLVSSFNKPVKKYGSFRQTKNATRTPEKHNTKELSGCERGSCSAKRAVEQGRTVAKKLGCAGFYVTSAVMNVGIVEVFDACIVAAMSSKQWKKKYKS